MIKKSIALSFAGLKNIVPNINNEENEFVFIFGDREIRMSKIYADFISPLISRHHISDPTINTYKYPEDESMKEIFTDEIISFVDSLAHGKTIKVDEVQSKKLQYLSVLLYNEELYLKINEIFPPSSDQIQIENIISHLSIHEYLLRFGDNDLIDASAEISSISQNFYKINPERLKTLPRKILLSVIRSPGLKLANEDSLLSFIYDIFSSETGDDDGFEKKQIDEIEFLELVEFSCLSPEKLFEFVELFDINMISQEIWSKLKKCIFVSPEEARKNGFNKSRYLDVNLKRFEYSGKEEGALKGIIFNLTKKCNGNVHDKNEVNITSSSTSSPHSPQKAADLKKKDSYYASENIANQWLKYDFKNREVFLTHYSISHTIGSGWSHPTEWVIEGSNTNNDDDWKMLDSRKNIKELNGVKTFEVENQSEYFQYIRLRQTGPSSLNSNNLNISAIEYFGAITNY